MNLPIQEKICCQKCGLEMVMLDSKKLWIDKQVQSIYRVEIGYVQECTFANVFIGTGVIGYYCEKCLQEGVNTK